MHGFHWFSLVFTGFHPAEKNRLRAKQLQTPGVHLAPVVSPAFRSPPGSKQGKYGSNRSILTTSRGKRGPKCSNSGPKWSFLRLRHAGTPHVRAVEALAHGSNDLAIHLRSAEHKVKGSRKLAIDTEASSLKPIWSPNATKLQGSPLFFIGFHGFSIDFNRFSSISTGFLARLEGLVIRAALEVVLGHPGPALGEVPHGHVVPPSLHVPEVEVDGASSKGSSI